MWDGSHDLGYDSKDLPCNTQTFFGVNAFGKLDMTVCNRSNDMIWGLYGANAVHFSVLQEYMATKIGVPVGRYFHLSNNYHAYLKTYQPLADAVLVEASPYDHISPFYLDTGIQDSMTLWDEDLETFFNDTAEMANGDFQTPFFNDVVVPLWEAHRSYREQTGEKRYLEAIAILDSCYAMDWRMACKDWITVRLDRFRVAQDAGVQHG